MDKLRSAGSSSRVGDTTAQLAAAAAADTTPATESAAATAAAAAALGGSEGQDADDAHRANAARGPTSLANLAAAQAATAAIESQQQGEKDEQQQQGLQQQLQQLQQLQVSESEREAVDANQPAAAKIKREEATKNQQQQQQQDDELARLAAQEAAITAASIQRLVTTTKIYLLSGDLKRSLTGKAKFAGKFAAATVGHRHVHLLSAESGLAGVLKQQGGVVFVETGQNMVQLNDEQAAAFEQRVAELAAPAGFVRHPAFSSSSSMDAKSEQQPDAIQAAVSSSSATAGAALVWRLPPGHMALRLVCKAGDAAA
jgi:hypothetical protein